MGAPKRRRWLKWGLVALLVYGLLWGISWLFVVFFVFRSEFKLVDPNVAPASLSDVTLEIRAFAKPAPYGRLWFLPPLVVRRPTEAHFCAIVLQRQRRDLPLFSGATALVRITEHELIDASMRTLVFREADEEIGPGEWTWCGNPTLEEYRLYLGDRPGSVLSSVTIEDSIERLEWRFRLEVDEGERVRARKFVFQFIRQKSSDVYFRPLWWRASGHE